MPPLPPADHSTDALKGTQETIATSKRRRQQRRVCMRVCECAHLFPLPPLLFTHTRSLCLSLSLSVSVSLSLCLSLSLFPPCPLHCNRPKDATEHTSSSLARTESTRVVSMMCTACSRSRDANNQRKKERKEGRKKERKGEGWREQET